MEFVQFSNNVMYIVRNIQYLYQLIKYSVFYKNIWFIERKEYL